MQIFTGETNTIAQSEILRTNDSILAKTRDKINEKAESINIDMNRFDKPCYYGTEAQGYSGETTKEADRSSHRRKAEVEVVLVSEMPFDPKK